MRSSKNKIPCSIQKECGLCPHVNDDYDFFLEKKFKQEFSLLKENNLTENAKVLRTIPSPRKLGYRTVFKLAVRANPNSHEKKRFRLGLFSPGSHRIGPDLTSCPLHSPLLRKLLKALSGLLEQTSLRPYDEETGKGDLRYLLARTNREGSALMMNWVVTRPLQELIEPIAQELIRQGFPLKVCALNINQEKGNAILGSETQFLSSEKVIEESLVDLRFSLGPTSFFQVNPWQAENIYLRIQQIAKSTEFKELAWDLYSGVGTIACVLAKSFKKVISFEENPEASELCKTNARLNALKGRVVCHQGLTEQSLEKETGLLEVPNLVVANPSRRGIEKQARSYISQMIRKGSQSEFIYVSCSVETLARDLVDLKKQGIQPFEFQAFDMHAQTNQLEWVVRLRQFL